MKNVLGDNIGSVDLIQHTGDDAGIVNAARVSLGKESDAFRWAPYEEEMKDGLLEGVPEGEFFETRLKDIEKDRKLIKYLLQNHHGTPFEHNCLTFRVKAPIFIARQWFRHRVGISINEISARYVEVKNEFYTPTKFRKQSASNRQASIDDGIEDENCAATQYKVACNIAFKAYECLLCSGVCREQARGVLPLSTYTEYFWTCNLRSFLHFIELRLHEGAQWEVKQYAKAMLEQVEKVFPETIKIWREIKERS